MYARIKSAKQVARRTRKVASLFESAPDWAKLKRDLDHGRIPALGAQIALTDADNAEYGITSRRTVPRFIQRYIKDNALPYVVESFRRDGVDYVKVYPVAGKKKARHV